MDRATFEAELKRDGYDVMTNATPGEIFAMPRGCLHYESYGPEGAAVLLGRKF